MTDHAGAARIGTLPPHTKGFDCNVRLTSAWAKAMYEHGYRFAVRYVRREQANNHDITAAEMLTILQAGLGIMLVQHVAPENWNPRARGAVNNVYGSGAAYGAVAAQEARAAGLPRGVTLWCDLEGVGEPNTAANVIAFCNNWEKAVSEAGFASGLYVGWHAGLNAHDLYYRLRFKRYWSAYNANREQIPEVRGVQMMQLAYPPPSHRAPVPFEYDEDIIAPDHMGDSPILLLPPQR